LGRFLWIGRRSRMKGMEKVGMREVCGRKRSFGIEVGV